MEMPHSAFFRKRLDGAGSSFLLTGKSFLSYDGLPHDFT
jgi:hypothetical protein